MTQPDHRRRRIEHVIDVDDDGDDDAVVVAWHCSRCTFLNTGKELQCGMCDRPRPADPSDALASQLSQVLAGQWTCAVCTLDNAADADLCDACGTARGDVVRQEQAAAAPATALPAGHWACGACTFHNPEGTRRCGVCGEQQPGAAHDGSSDDDDDDDDTLCAVCGGPVDHCYCVPLSVAPVRPRPFAAAPARALPLNYQRRAQQPNVELLEQRLVRRTRVVSLDTVLNVGRGDPEDLRGVDVDKDAGEPGILVSLPKEKSDCATPFEYLTRMAPFILAEHRAQLIDGVAKAEWHEIPLSFFNSNVLDTDDGAVATFSLGLHVPLRSEKAAWLAFVQEHRNFHPCNYNDVVVVSFPALDSEQAVLRVTAISCTGRDNSNSFMWDFETRRTEDVVARLENCKRLGATPSVARLHNLAATKAQMTACKFSHCPQFWPAVCDPGAQMSLPPDELAPEILSSLLNPSQKMAVAVACQGIARGVGAKPFTLVQGPPGTGKTQTITAIIAHYLALTGKRHRVLVVAPSNTAVDEVMLRLSQSEHHRGINLLRLGIKKSVHATILSNGWFMEDRIKELMGPVGPDDPDDEEPRRGKRMTRGQARNKLLEEANVVFSTIGSVKNLPITCPFVIVDEAAQTTEPQTLLPIANGCQRCVLVGDPRQLQATVLSKTADDAGYGCSLMQRLLLAGHASTLLDTQYRMHPAISSFPNRYFYDGRLNDAPNTFHRGGASNLAPLVFFDVKGEESGDGTSKCNPIEAAIVAQVRRALTYLPDRESRSVGVITFYDAQKRCILRELGRGPWRDDVANVDGFQGKERDVVIISSVRAAKPFAGTIGFIHNRNRLNVALTRAKHAVYVVGDAAHLAKMNVMWRALLEHCHAHGTVIDVASQNGRRVALPTVQ
jgi:hypothetical protein